MPKFGATAVLILLAVAFSASAQVERASIIGNVTDSTGAAMPGVEVTVNNEATNTSLKLDTDESGAYTAVNLIPGSYAVKAARTGFADGLRNFVPWTKRAAGHAHGSGAVSTRQWR
jgi:protocatechuate 3,4-dioxygenase beta subunit